MASSMSNVDLAAREDMPDMSDVRVSPSALVAPREGERAENAPMQPSSIEDSRVRGWQSAWSKTLVWFLKVLPEGLQTLRGMNATGEIDDDSMCSLGVNVFTEAQRTGCLKWPSLQQCLTILAPRERLQRFASCNPPNFGCQTQSLVRVRFYP